MLRLLKAQGFTEDRSRGSHFILKHPDNPSCGWLCLSHGTKNLPIGTLRSILKQANLSVEAYRGLL